MNGQFSNFDLGTGKEKKKSAGGPKIHRPLFSRINPNKTLGFLNNWFSHPTDLAFCPLTTAINSCF
jgi:hypothetical protein